MKLSLLQLNHWANNFCSPSSAPLNGGTAPSDGPVLCSPTALFWFILHALCCIISLALDFHFSCLLFVLLFALSSSPPSSPPSSSSNAALTSDNPLSFPCYRHRHPSPPPMPPPAVSSSITTASLFAHGLTRTPTKRLRRRSCLMSCGRG